MDPSTLDPFSIITWLIAGGALGGIAEYLRQIAYRGKGLVTNDHELHAVPVILLLLASAVIGLSGAIAIQFIFILLQSFKDENTASNIIFLFSISVAAGFGARSILPLLTKKLEKKIEGADEKATEAGQTATAAKDEAQEAWFFAKIMTALSPVATESERQWGIEELTARLQNVPTHRSYVLWLGRLYRARKDYQSAINVLDDFLRRKEQKNERDKDYADVLYNKACYYAVLWEDTTDETKKGQYKKIALDSLSTSIVISPENKIDAISDPDFKKLKELEEFKQMPE